MKNLLSTLENRRLEFVKLLANQKDWLILSEAAKVLDCSVRVLKNDIQFLNDEFYKELTIQTSINGVRIKFEYMKGPKSFAQQLLHNSDSYQLLETIFFNEHQSLTDIAEKLFISPATIYRMVKQINEILSEDYGFYIETNPCRIIGDEEKIRYFFYCYFFEKYPTFAWPFKNINERVIDKFLKEILEALQMPVDFAYFNVFKVIVMVNFIRYKNNNLIPIKSGAPLNRVFLPDREEYEQFYLYFEQTLDVKIDDELIWQVFRQYVQPGIFMTYENFLNTIENDSDLADEVLFIREVLETLAQNNEIEFKNIESTIYEMYITAKLEYMEPQSGYILYNRNTYFTNDLKNEFPVFYKQIYEGMKAFREKIGKPITEDGINFYIYSIFSRWENLVPELRRKLDKIKVLVISDRHFSHARMIKDFIEYEFSEQITIDIFSEMDLDQHTLAQLECDLIVSAFPLEEDIDVRNVYISNMPKYKDYVRIQEHIDDIIKKRIDF